MSTADQSVGDRSNNQPPTVRWIYIVLALSVAVMIAVERGVVLYRHISDAAQIAALRSDIFDLESERGFEESVLAHSPTKDSPEARATEAALTRIKALLADKRLELTNLLATFGDRENASGKGAT